MAPFDFTLGDPDFYTPMERSVELDDPATRFAPTTLPAEWERTPQGIWTRWSPAGHRFPEQGWKVHVAARPDRAATVLDTVAAICAEQGVGFKHLATRRTFLWMHHKHGPRQQSGKFCALYPDGEDAARQLMEALRTALAGERGAYPLTDRRYRDSGVVAYRYGGFTTRSRLQADGTQQQVMLDTDGVEVPDLRRPEFTLPDGVVDPFAEAGPARDPGPVSFGGLTFDRVLRHSNGGGAYAASTTSGTPVFVKEARGDNGYHWDGSSATERLGHEYRVLTELHRIMPGIAPEPLHYFTHWEHEFLVTEFVPGRSLWTWMVLNNPLIMVRPDRARVESYFARCRSILSVLQDQLDRLRAAGYCFGDLNPHNILVDDDDVPRLIDFEAAGEITGKRFAIGTVGYVPPSGATDGPATDEYGLAGIAQMLVLTLHPVLERNPDAAEHLFADAGAVGPVPADVRELATRHRRLSARPVLPRPDEVVAHPHQHLRDLRDATVAGLHAMAGASAGHPDNPVFPTSSWGWATNRHCVEHGTAGVLHALRVAGEPIDPDLVDRFRRDALGAQDDLPPGLFVGSSGIAWVLADLGRIDEARTLLDRADRHRLTATGATLGEGAAGVALTHLALHGHTGDDRHLRRAHELLTGLPAGDGDLVPLLGRDEATGWRRGRIGIAQALFYAGELCADPALTRRGLALLHRDLDRAVTGDNGLLFPVSARDRRIEPYLDVGSAGFALVTGRYLDAHADERLATAHADALVSCAVPMSVSAGLWNGTAGLGFALADHAHRTADRATHEAALGNGRAMYKYAVPAAPGDVRYLSGIDTRFRADLAGGSAGILIFLARLLDGVTDAAFTLDALVERTRTAPSHAAPELVPA